MIDGKEFKIKSTKLSIAGSQVEPFVARRACVKPPRMRGARRRWRPPRGGSKSGNPSVRSPALTPLHHNLPDTIFEFLNR
ncbi:unnamed protein product [Plutella xylostella]|uniref:(diamondback moth) hypothetical protein n=1 Tax=Plutella xylostella TaxID=51655 RepID=A0A8S4DKN3_PLUXY|nr:unnamed protein product [Plutella xylostella]